MSFCRGVHVRVGGVNEWDIPEGRPILPLMDWPQLRSLAGKLHGLKPGKDGQSSITLTDDLFAGQGFLALTTNWYDDAGHVLALCRLSQGGGV